MPIQDIFTYDIDGVILLEVGGKFVNGIKPRHPDDIIVTGRSAEEKPETIRMLTEFGILNRVYFNPIPFDEKTRESSGKHKAAVIKHLTEIGYNVMVHFEDDPKQILEIKAEHPELNVVYMSHDLTNKENVRRDTW